MKKLSENSAIGLVAPAFAAEDAVWDECAKAFQHRGYAVKEFGRFEDPDGRFAGTDSARANHLQRAFADPEVAAIVAVRGGSGCSRMLDHLNFNRIAQTPKPFVGYSDITALLVALHSQVGLIGFHGPMAVDIHGKRSEYSIQGLLDVLEGRRSTWTFDEDFRCARAGKVTGTIFGGNLSVFESLIGTPEFVMPSNAILLLEDLNEYDYRIDRALVHFRRAKVFDSCVAVLLGKSVLAGDDSEDGFMELALQHLEQFPGPIAAGLPFGHTHRQATIPFGASVNLSVSGDAVRLDFAQIWDSALNSQIAAE